jgi:hypothetical protein
VRNQQLRRADSFLRCSTLFFFEAPSGAALKARLRCLYDAVSRSSCARLDDGIARLATVRYFFTTPETTVQLESVTTNEPGATRPRRSDRGGALARRHARHCGIARGGALAGRHRAGTARIVR